MVFRRSPRVLLFCGLAVATAVGACGARTPLGGESAQAPSDGGAPDVRVRQDSGSDALPPIVAPPRDAARPSECEQLDVPLVYLLSSEAELFRFDPPARTFTKVANISCRRPGPVLYDEQPNSMAVDRRGIAYTNFTDGTLWRLDTRTAGCTPTPYTPRQRGFVKFGMAFVSNASIDELFVTETSARESLGLGRIDTSSTFALSVIGPYTPPLGRCELTGTGDERLFAFCLDQTSGSTLAEIDRSTATVLASDTLAVGGPNVAFAVAFWGGSFWLFTSEDDAEGTIVTQYDPTTKTETTVARTSAQIVGAGVSTCAPL